MQQNQAGAGVQTLINRIRDEAVSAGKQHADQLLEQAHREAAKIIAEAKTQASVLHTQSHQDIKAQEAAALADLRTASRDTILSLKANVTSAFERYVHRLVSAATMEPETIKCLVLVLAGHAVDDFIGDKSIKIAINALLFSDKQTDTDMAQLNKQLSNVVLGLSADMLRDGVELIASDDVQGGARVTLLDEDVEIDLSGKAITQLLLQFLSPRFIAIIEGVE